MQDLDRFPTGGREGLAQIARLHSGRNDRASDTDGTTRPIRTAQTTKVSGCTSPHWLSRPALLCPFTSSCHGPVPSSHLQIHRYRWTPSGARGST